MSSCVPSFCWFSLHVLEDCSGRSLNIAGRLLIQKHCAHATTLLNQEDETFILKHEVVASGSWSTACRRGIDQKLRQRACLRICSPKTILRCDWSKLKNGGVFPYLSPTPKLRNFVSYTRSHCGWDQSKVSLRAKVVSRIFAEEQQTFH